MLVVYVFGVDSLVKEMKRDLVRFALMPILALFYWRGTWVLCDEYLYKNDMKKTCFASLIIGYGGLVVSLFLQVYSEELLRRLSNNRAKKLHPFLEMLVFGIDRLHIYIVGFEVVNCWRGLWFLQDIYILPHSKAHSAWISHAIGVISLMILSVSPYIIFIPLISSSRCNFQSVLAPPVLLLSDNQPVPIADGYRRLSRNLLSTFHLIQEDTSSVPIEDASIEVSTVSDSIIGRGRTMSHEGGLDEGA
jgi:hypothetical protein